MKKKAIIILAVACMGMGLLACGKGRNEGGGDSEKETT